MQQPPPDHAAAGGPAEAIDAPAATPAQDRSEPEHIACDFCGELCADFAQRDGQRMCICCVSTRLAEDRETLADFERVMVAHGFDAEAGEYDWLETQLTALAKFRAASAEVRSLARCCDSDEDGHLTLELILDVLDSVEKKP